MAENTIEWLRAGSASAVPRENSPVRQVIEIGVFVIPWAFLLFLAVVVYAVVELAGGNLGFAEFVDASTAAGALLIGHGVHHLARKGAAGPRGHAAKLLGS